MDKLDLGELENLASELRGLNSRGARKGADAIDTLIARVGMLEAALRELANAADNVGVRHFDTDTMSPEVEAMQAATLRARAALEGSGNG